MLDVLFMSVAMDEHVVNVGDDVLGIRHDHVHQPAEAGWSPH